MTPAITGEVTPQRTQQAINENCPHITKAIPDIDARIILVAMAIMCIGAGFINYSPLTAIVLAGIGIAATITWIWLAMKIPEKRAAMLQNELEPMGKLMVEAHEIANKPNFKEIWSDKSLLPALWTFSFQHDLDSMDSQIKLDLIGPKRSLENNFEDAQRHLTLITQYFPQCICIPNNNELTLDILKDVRQSLEAVIPQDQQHISRKNKILKMISGSISGIEDAQNKIEALEAKKALLVIKLNEIEAEKIRLQRLSIVPR